MTVSAWARSQLYEYGTPLTGFIILAICVLAMGANTVTN
jgi:hypothetical protein